MGDLQSQQDSPLRPYGHEVALAKPVPRRLASWLVWTGVATQVALAGTIGLIFVIPSADLIFDLLGYAWIPSLASGTVALFAYFSIDANRRLADKLGVIFSVVLTVLGSLWWVLVAMLLAFASV